jgi:kumamolisin
MNDPTNPNLHNLILQPLPGSERPPAPEAAVAPDPLDPDSLIAITLVLRRRAEVPDEALSSPLQPAELAATYGADPADLELVTRTMTALGAQIVEVDIASRRVRIAGTAGLLGQLFGTALEQVTSTDRPAAGSSTGTAAVA